MRRKYNDDLLNFQLYTVRVMRITGRRDRPTLDVRRFRKVGEARSCTSEYVVLTRLSLDFPSHTLSFLSP